MYRARYAPKTPKGMEVVLKLVKKALIHTFYGLR